MLEEVRTVAHLELQSILISSPDAHLRLKKCLLLGNWAPSIGVGQEDGGVESSQALRQIRSSVGDLT